MEEAPNIDKGGEITNSLCRFDEQLTVSGRSAAAEIRATRPQKPEQPGDATNRLSGCVLACLRRSILLSICRRGRVPCWQAQFTCASVNRSTSAKLAEAAQVTTQNKNILHPQVAVARVQIRREKVRRLIPPQMISTTSWLHMLYNG